MPFSSVSVVEFEQVNVRQEKTSCKNLPSLKFWKSETREKLEEYESEFKKQLLNELLNNSKQMVNVFMQRNSNDKLVQISRWIKPNERKAD